MAFRNPNRDDRLYREWREGWDDEYERRAAYERESGRDTERVLDGGEPDFTRNPFSDRDDRGDARPRGRETSDFARDDFAGDLPHRVNTKAALGYGASSSVGGSYGEESNPAHQTDYDFGSRGTHAGRGPKGYRRSDERIRDDVADRLTDDDRVDASDVEISVAGGIVTLAGTVDSRETKRRAEDIAASVSGVHDVDNHLRVAPANA
jgi:hypothetical protein